MQEINFSNKNGLWCKGKVKMTLAHHKHKSMIMYIKELWLCYVVRKNGHITCKAICLINPLRHGWWVDVVRRKLKIFHARERWQLTFHTKFVSQIHLKIWEITLKNCQTNTPKTFFDKYLVSSRAKRLLVGRWRYFTPWAKHRCATHTTHILTHCRNF